MRRGTGSRRADCRWAGPQRAAARRAPRSSRTRAAARAAAGAAARAMERGGRGPPDAGREPCRPPPPSARRCPAGVCHHGASSSFRPEGASTSEMMPRSMRSGARAVKCEPIRMPGIEPIRIEPTTPKSGRAPESVARPAATVTIMAWNRSVPTTRRAASGNSVTRAIPKNTPDPTEVRPRMKPNTRPIVTADLVMAAKRAVGGQLGGIPQAGDGDERAHRHCDPDGTSTMPISTGRMSSMLPSTL